MLITVETVSVQLLDSVSDAMAFGALEPCPECGGQFVFRFVIVIPHQLYSRRHGIEHSVPSICRFVCTLKEKRLELLTPKSVDL